MKVYTVMVSNSAKLTGTFHLHSLNKEKTTTCDVRNVGPGLEQTQYCGWAKPVNWIISLPS